MNPIHESITGPPILLPPTSEVMAFTPPSDAPVVDLETTGGNEAKEAERGESPRALADEMCRLENRMVALKIIEQEKLPQARRQPHYPMFMRNFRYTEKALHYKYITKSIFRALLKRAWEDVTGRRVILFEVDAENGQFRWLTREQMKELLKPSSEEETGSFLLFDRYRVDVPFAEGGFGKIFSGVDFHTGRQVAIKCTEPDNVSRLRREAEAMSHLTHPNILPLLDYGVEQGYGFLVTPLIQGANMEALLMQGGTERWDVFSLSEKMLSLSDALVHIHGAGLIHRDIKPANILVEEVTGTAYLGDFGLTRGDSLPTGVTCPGELVGTPKFMAPEQFQDEAVTTKMDSWQWGATFWALIKGHPPFDGVDFREVATNVQQTPYPSLREGCKNFPIQLDKLLRRCLEKNPADRPTMDTVRRDLALFVKQGIGKEIIIPLPKKRKRFWLF